MRTTTGSGWWGPVAGFGLAVVASCAPVPAPSSTASSPAPEITARELPVTGATPTGSRLASRPELRVAIRPPRAAPYNATVIGPSAVLLNVRVENAGARAAAVDGLHLDFRVSRGDVTFPCHEHLGGKHVEREPAYLEPGDSFVFSREVDCAMPLPGRYTVEPFVRFGDGGARGDRTDPFTLDVTEGAAVPHPYPGRAGLYALMTGSTVTQPLSSEAWARGDYHVVVALINGSNVVVPLAPTRLAFHVYRVGSPLACSGASERVAVPESLGPGETYTAQAAVTCAPSEEGEYLLVGHLAVGDPGAEGLEIGRVPLHVSRDPTLLPGHVGADMPPSPYLPKR